MPFVPAKETCLHLEHEPPPHANNERMKWVCPGCGESVVVESANLRVIPFTDHYDCHHRER